eukprot:TRINITY_DN8010_c0_g1_i2.p1 TRINITY_DN8010_c0_g1~~TRINITY_DN8010_c0_g1_i2.p1  ORF type:complete len:706 (-),score=137.65 TRINITY_DN8010_c0_g1_i2:20-2137(-)
MHDGTKIPHGRWHGLAMSWLTRLGRPQNYGEAINCYNKCRKKKACAGGGYNLAILTLQGMGVTQDLKQGIALLEEAASLPPYIEEGGMITRNKGVAEAQNALGNAYLDGTGVDKDAHKAVIYFLQSAHNQCSAAMTTLGSLYQNGEGVPLDPKRAVQWYKRSCDVNQASSALYNLGQCYLWGIGVTPNLDQARRYLHSSVEAGCDPHHNIGPLLDHINDPLFKEVWTMMIRVKSGQEHHVPVSPERYPLSMLQEHAHSAFVNKVLFSKREYLRIRPLLDDLPSLHEQQVEMIQGLANAYRSSELPVAILNRNVACIIQIAQELYQQGDQDGGVVYAYLKGCTQLNWAEKFYEECYSKWPTPYFLYKMAETNACCQHYSRATANFTALLKVLPSGEGIYARAKSRMRDGDHKGGRKDYLHFLQVTLSDVQHPKRPKAYYALAASYLHLSIATLPSVEDMTKMREYYILGEEAEKEMVPCFLPIVDINKDRVRMIVTGEVAEVTSKSKNRLTLLQREACIVYHNQQVALFFGKEGWRSMSRLDCGVIHPIDILECKPMLLDEMYPTQEHMYRGRVLKGFLFGTPLLLMPYTYLLIEDDDGDIFNIAFHDRKLKDIASARQFYCGKKVAIVNPFHRLSPDGRLIAVDDAMSVIFLPSRDQLYCEYCCKTDQDKSVKYECSRCHVVNYCSKECQVADWRLGHKMTCPLK